MKTPNKQRPRRLLVTAVLIAAGLTAFTAPQARAADDEAVGMIVELITGSDADMQQMAIQQIREQAPGKGATKRFAELLPKLKPETQAKLIDALGVRGDAAARPAIIKMVDSKQPAVRVAIAGALATLGQPEDVPVLAKFAAAGSDAEKTVAANSLRKLRGDKMNAAMIELLKTADAKTKIELISALVDRKAKEAMPTVTLSIDDKDSAVRLAVLDALRAMGDENQVAVIVKRLTTVEDKTEQRKAALALMFTCRRGKAKCAEAVIAGFKSADTRTKIFMMRALTEAGGQKSLDQIVTLMTDADKTVSASALRTLTGWPERNAVPQLKKLAADVKNTSTHVLAVRGIIRLASAAKDLPADLTIMGDAMKLASRKEEKILILGALAVIPTGDSLTMTAACLDTPELAENAAVAAVMIAEKLPQAQKAQAKPIIEKVIKTTKNEKTQARAKKVLETL